MKFTGVLLRPLADQERDDRTGPIDPAGVSFDPQVAYPLTDNFNSAVPPIGWVRPRLEDGQLVVEGELFEDPEGPGIATYGRKLAIGVVTNKLSGSVVTRSKLWSATLCVDNSDIGMPDITIEEEP